MPPSVPSSSVRQTLQLRVLIRLIPISAWVMLGASLVLTGIAWQLTSQQVRRYAEERFAFRTQEIELAIRQRMTAYEQALRGGIGLYYASDQVTREAWRTYVENEQLSKYYPGIQGMGVSLWLKPEDVPEHIAAVRAEGFPDYTIRPTEKRDFYTAIIYLEPFDARNQRAFGYDMYSEPTRRHAMELAMNTGQPAISGLVTLVQETDQDVQPGFLCYLPLFRPGLPLDSPAQRRAALQGFVYAAFRSHDLMRGILGVGEDDVQFEIFDGEKPVPEALLYHSSPLAAAADRSQDRGAGPDQTGFAHELPVELSGRQWLLRFSPGSDFLSVAERNQGLMVGGGGLVINLLLFIIIAAIARQKQQAQLLAERMTAEWKDTTAQLQITAARQQAILDGARHAIISTDPDGTVTAFNRGAELLLGYQASDVVGKHTPALWHDADEVRRRAEELTAELGYTIEPGFESFVAKARTGAVDDNEWTLIARDKSRVPVELSVGTMRDETGRITGFLGIIADISKRKKAESEIQRLNADLEERVHRRTIELEAMNSALIDFKAALDEHAIVAITDVHGKITYANDKFCAISKYSREELIGQDHRLVNSGHHPKEFIRDLWQTISRGRVWRGEIKNRAKDGSHYWVDTTIVPLLDEQDRPVQFIAIRANITVRKKTEESLQLANTELAQTSRHKDQFLANMSHELRTPLNAILGLSEALLEQLGGPLTPRQIRSVTTISTSGRHLLSLINDILDLSQIEAGALQLHPDSLPLKSFCESCLILVRTQASKKNLRVVFETSDHIDCFTADPKRFKQVLVNLLTNAVKFTPEGGSLGLKVTLAPDNHSVVFTVWDTGVGIASADHAKLFRAFTQLDSGFDRAQEGTGLGLAMVAKLVDLHGGSVILESELGQGSRFVVSLPQQNESAPSDGRSPSTARRSDETDRRAYARALLIEDDNSAHEQLARYLEELSITTIRHPSGDGAVHLARSEQPDVILLDLLLPDQNGWDVMARLKNDPATCDIPVVVISVMDEPEKPQSKAAAYFTKPVTREQLAQFFQRETAGPSVSDPALAIPARPLGPTIVLAEDNEANIQTLGEYLEDQGYDMHYARNGLIAVQLTQKLNPALVLMDIQMPEMDGLTAIAKIRADANHANLPIIALTALAMPGDRERCLEAGATDYLSKPVSLKGLVTLIKTLLHP